MTRFVIHNHMSPKRVTRDTNVWEHNVPRDVEEANRIREYKKAGITRVNDARATKPMMEDGKWWFTTQEFDVNGKDVRRTYGPFKTEAEANAKRVEVKAKPEFRGR